MGAWGTAIFSDDTALDIRDEWREAILDGLSAEEATARLLKSFDDYFGDDEDTEKLFWMAFAAAQFETGRLLPEVRDRALAIIDGGGDVARWDEDGDEVSARQRERVLERLAAKLRGPQPKPKRLRRTPSLSIPFDVGDVVRVYEEDGANESAGRRRRTHERRRAGPGCRRTRLGGRRGSSPRRPLATFSPSGPLRAGQEVVDLGHDAVEEGCLRRSRRRGGGQSSDVRRGARS